MSRRSPTTGGVRLIDAGYIVQTTDTTGLVVVTQIEPVSVLFFLPEDDFGVVNRQIAAGPLSVTASSRADNKALGQGTLLLINNQIDQTTGTIQLKATFPNKDHALWPGQFVDVQLPVETRHNAVTVPSAAVQLGPQGVYAYVVKAGNEIQMVPIKVSTANAGGPVTLIDSGLSAGDEVVIDGQLKLRPGATVKASAAAPLAAPLAPSFAATLPRRQRARSMAHSKVSRSTTTTKFSPPRPGTTSSLPTATARRCASATLAGPWTGRRTPNSPPGRTARRASCWRCSNSPAPT
jgi:hypothetical protein